MDFSTPYTYEFYCHEDFIDKETKKYLLHNPGYSSNKRLF